MSVTPAQPKENRCFSKRHFLLITKQGLIPKPQFNLTTPHGDLENSQALSVFLNWGVTAFGTEQILGGAPNVPKASGIPALPSL